MKLDNQLHRDLSSLGISEWIQPRDHAQIPLTELAAQVLKNEEARFLANRGTPEERKEKARHAINARFKR